MRQPARGGAFLVIDSTRAGVLAQELALNLRATLTPIGTVSLRSDPRQTATIAQIVLPQGVTRAFVFAFRDRPPGEPVAPYTESCALLLTQEVPALGAGGGLVLAPASVQTPRPTDVYANSVSDGLNSFMAVSWVTDQDFPPQPLSVTVNAAWAARFSPAVVRGFTAQTVGPPNIAPEETRYIHIEADIHPGVVGAINAGGITEVIRDLLSLLVGLARQGYAVDHGIELLKMAEKTASLKLHGRALAGLAAVARMVFLRAARGERSIVVEARKVWNQAPAIVPLARGEAQLVLVLNGHEPQRPEEIVPANNGRIVLPLREASTQHWDFDLNNYRVPRREDVDSAVEVHVTDAETGAHGFVLVGPYPVR
jgi:hypothetical protein